MEALTYRGYKMSGDGWVIGRAFLHFNRRPNTKGFDPMYRDFIFVQEAVNDVFVPVWGYTVGLATGLRDMDGAMIYEGEILAIEWRSEVLV